MSYAIKSYRFKFEVMHLKNLIIQSKSWEDFQENIASLNKKQKGDTFELLTKLYFKLNPVYEFYDEVWLLSELPQKELDFLELPSQDLGIDLIAKNGKEYHAIQCKYHHDPTKNLRKNELNSFLDVTTRICKGKFSTLLAVTSAHDYSIILEKFAPKVTYCLSDQFQALDEDFFRQARALIRHQTPKLRKRTPRPHQKTAIRNANRKKVSSVVKLVFSDGR